MTRKFLVTGGAGFIGSAVVRLLIEDGANEVAVVDKLTYASTLDSLDEVSHDSRYRFFRCDIGDAGAMRDVFANVMPDVVIHLAAESHVDRSIDGPAVFLETNVSGTFVLLQEAVHYLQKVAAGKRDTFRFLHVSTDEVFGSLRLSGRFTEQSAYRPNSPYAASKAASDHLVRAWHHTFGLPVVISNCSNNYGPYQFPEKLIPTVILNAIERKPIPVYGQGENVRDWLYVDDHARALLLIAEQGRLGESYNVGAHCERKNLDVVKELCAIVDSVLPETGAPPREALVTFVTDRPGHDFRYAIDASRITSELGWKPQVSFEQGLQETVRWYLDHREWWTRIRSGRYGGERLGIVV